MLAKGERRPCCHHCRHHGPGSCLFLLPTNVFSMQHRIHKTMRMYSTEQTQEILSQVWPYQTTLLGIVLRSESRQMRISDFLLPSQKTILFQWHSAWLVLTGWEESLLTLCCTRLCALKLCCVLQIEGHVRPERTDGVWRCLHRCELKPPSSAFEPSLSIFSLFPTEYKFMKLCIFCFRDTES